MAIRALLGYQHPDSSAAINDRTKDVVVKGVYRGGFVQTLPGELAVLITKFVTVTLDGMSVREDDADTRIEIPAAGATYRIFVRGQYRVKQAPIAALEILTEADFLADPDVAGLITLVRIVVPPAATQVNLADLDYTVRDSGDPLMRGFWRPPVATYASLPLPPPAANNDVKVGDVALTLDTGLPYVFLGASGWVVIDKDGFVALGDVRWKIVSSTGSTPYWEHGRAGRYEVAHAGDFEVTAQPPTYPVLTQVSSLDADAVAAAAMAVRALRVGPTNTVYAKGRSNLAAIVQPGDLRIGFVTGVATYMSIVSPGDVDDGDPVAPAVGAYVQVDGLESYVYLKLGGNPAAVEIGDVRLWQVAKNPKRMGLRGGGTLVAGGDADVGDTITHALYPYSTSAGTEYFYASNTAALTVVTGGDLITRCSNVPNPACNPKQRTNRRRSDRGQQTWARPVGAADPESYVQVDAGLTGSPFAEIVEAGVSSGQLVRARLAALQGASSAADNPTSAGGTPVLADSLHVHAAQNRGDGVVSGLLATSGGGLVINVALGQAVCFGALRSIAAAPGLVMADNTVNYVYVDGSLPAPAVASGTTPALALSTPGNVPLFTVTTSGGAVVTNGLKDVRRFVTAIDDKILMTVGSSTGLAHFTSLQAAVDWYLAYTTQSPPLTARSAVLWLKEKVVLTSSVRLAGTRGLTIMGSPRAGNPATGVGGIVEWAFDGPAFDVGGAEDLSVEGLHFYCSATGGVGTFPLTACFGNAPSAVAVGQHVQIRRCTTQSQNGVATNKLRHFVRITTGAVNFLSVEGCVADVTDFGILLPAASGTNHCRFVRNVFKQSGTSVAGNTWGVTGIFLGGGDDTTVEGNLIHPPSFDGSLAGDGFGFQEGINVSAGLRTICRGNLIHYVGATGTATSRGIVGNAHYGVVADNVVESAMAGYEGIVCAATSPVTIACNVVRLTSSTAGAGIDVAGGDKVVLIGNVVESASSSAQGIDTNSGLGSAGDDCLIAHNFVSMTDASGGSTQDGIRVTGTSGSRYVVQGNVVKNATDDGNGIYVGSSIDHAVVAGNAIHMLGVLAGGLGAGVFSNGDHVVIAGNTVQSSCPSGFGIGVDDGNDVQVVANSVVVTGSAATPLIVTSDVEDKILIQGNDLNASNTSAELLNFFGGVVSQVSILGNQFSGVANRVVTFGNLTKSTFEGNVGTVTCNSVAFNCNGVDQLVFKGNCFTINPGASRTSASAILEFASGSGLQVLGNYFSAGSMGDTGSIWVYALRLNSAPVTCAHNRLELTDSGDPNVSYTAIRIEPSGPAAGFVVQGNYISTTNGAPLTKTDRGIYAGSNADSVKILDNQHFGDGAGSVGIDVEADEVHVRGNSVNSNIRVGTSASSVVVESNYCEAGIVCAGDQCQIISNDVVAGDDLSGSPIPCIDLQSTCDTVVCSDNRVRTTVINNIGIKVSAARAVVSSNTIKMLFNGCIGINLRTGGAVIQGNVFHSNGDAGSYSLLADVAVTGAVVAGNTNVSLLASPGLVFTADLVDAAITGNVLLGRSNGVPGIHITFAAAGSKNVNIVGNVIDNSNLSLPRGLDVDAAVTSPIGNIDVNIATINDGPGWRHLFTAGAVETNRVPA